MLLLRKRHERHAYENWLAAVGTIERPKWRGAERHHEVLSLDVVRELALLKVRLPNPPRQVTDMLSCLRVDRPRRIARK